MQPDKPSHEYDQVQLADQGFRHDSSDSVTQTPSKAKAAHQSAVSAAEAPLVKSNDAELKKVSAKCDRDQVSSQFQVFSGQIQDQSTTVQSRLAVD